MTELGVTPREALIAAIQQADAAFFVALTGRDIVALEGLLADDFLIVDVASGSVHQRAALVEAIGAGTVAFREIRTFPGEAVIRLLGPDAGIVVGRTAMTISDPAGDLVEVASRYTHVLHSRRGVWRLVSAQGTPIAGTTP